MEKETALKANPFCVPVALSFQGGACELWSRVLRQGFSRTIKAVPER